MKLYIIGNGFDIAHGLYTSYWNFRKFLEDKYPEFLNSFEKLYDIEPLDDTEPWYTDAAQMKWEERVNKELWSEFEKEMGTPNIQSMLDFSSSIIGDMSEEMITAGIKDTMDYYWRQEYGYIKKLQKYVKEWISTYSLENIIPRKKDICNNTNDYFLNFNYTNLLEEVYGAKNVIHIHGGIGHNVSYAPFMGHCNQKDIITHEKYASDAFEEYNDGEASIQSAIAEYLKTILKDTEHYINLNEKFFKKLKGVDEIIVIGWSAGDVDIPYLCKVRDSVISTAKWNVYYYNDYAKKGLETAFQNNNIHNYELINSELFWDC